MTVVINGTTGITNDGGYTGDGVVFADTTPANTLVTTTGGNVGIGTSSPSTKLHVSGGASSVSGSNGITGIANGNTSGGMKLYAFTAAGTANGYLAFEGYDKEYGRFDSSGNLLAGTSTTRGSPNGINTYWAASGVNTNVSVIGDTSGTGYHWTFNRGTGSLTEVGSIRSSGSTTTYGTTSDYRLKENVQPMQGALSLVAKLNPCTYTWKIDGSDGQGFIAHELQAVVPDCVSGEKDAVNEDGSIRPQAIDTSFLVATLTAAIQELKAELDAAKADIATLKAPQ